MTDRLIVGCGYLGRRVARLWHRAGDRVFVTTRSPARAEAYARDGLHPVVCDVLAPASLARLPATATTVHCVGLDRAAGVPMRDVYVGGLGHLLSALADSSGAFVQVSSTSVYGQVAGELVDEGAATEPADESGRIVLEAERLVRDRRPGAIILRFAGIYGPGRLLRAREIRAGSPLVGDPAKWLNLIHVDDGAVAVVRAADRAAQGLVFNVADGTPVRRGDFYARLAEVLGAPVPTWQIPPPGAPAAPHDRANRRIVAARLWAALPAGPAYPSYVEGLAAASHDEPGEP